jgi:hypothetical protein
LLGWFGVVSWPLAVAVIVFVFVLGFVLFPYITPFDLIPETEMPAKPSA